MDNKEPEANENSGRTEFIRNSETGIVEAWRDGRKICDMYGMGDFIGKQDGNAE